MSAELTQRLARNTILQLIGKTAGTLLGVVTVAVLLRNLGTFGFGEFTTAITFVTLFATLVDFGLTLTTVQMISEPDADEHRVLSNMLSLRLISGLFFFSASVLIGLFFPYSNAVKLAIGIGAIAYFFATFTQLLVGIFQKRLEMWRVVVAELVNRVTFFGGVLLVAILHGGVIAFVGTVMIAAVLQCLVLVALTRPFVKLKWHLHTDMWGEIIKRSWPIGATIFFNLIYLRGDIVFLSLMRTTEEVGAYGAAYKMVDVITAIPAMFMGLVLPILVRTWKNNDKETFHKTMQNTFDVFAIVAVPIAVGAYALAEPIMVFIGGAEFRAAGPIMKWLAPTSAIVFFGNLFAHAVIALNAQRRVVLGFATVAVVSIIGYLVFIPRFGVFGAVGVTLFSELTITILVFVVTSAVSKRIPSLTVMAKALLSAVIMFLLLPAFGSMNLLVQIFLGSLVYLVALTALGGLHPKQLKRLII
ncbi:MAG: flippase [Patescibacteria group bacterium]